jgi:DNA-binding transcriptional regulator YiaG
MNTESQGVYRSEAAAAIKEMIEGFERAGLVDKQTLRKFVALCMTTTPPIEREEIKATRASEQ